MEFVFKHMQGAWPLVNLIDAYRQPREIWQFKDTSYRIHITLEASSAIVALQTLFQHPDMQSAVGYLKRTWLYREPQLQTLFQDFQQPDFPWSEYTAKLQHCGLMRTPRVDFRAD